MQVVGAVPPGRYSGREPEEEGLLGDWSCWGGGDWIGGEEEEEEEEIVDGGAGLTGGVGWGAGAGVEIVDELGGRA